MRATDANEKRTQRGGPLRATEEGAEGVEDQMAAGLEHEKLSEAIIGSAIKVHRALGPGLLESAYETCLVHELCKTGLRIARQVELPIVYDSITLESGFRLDMVVEDSVIVELKSIDKLAPIHEAQLMTYLRLSGKSVGLLINFNVTRLIDGVVRRAMSHSSPRPSAALRVEKDLCS